MSFELTSGINSISDDSGFSLDSTNNSSRAEKRTELVESDEFDSLDNYSDGGMSAENFNTMRKVLPPIEFQDSPQTTLMRFTLNYAQRLANNIIHKAIKEIAMGFSNPNPDTNTIIMANSKRCNLEKKKSNLDTETLRQKIMSNNQMIYGSDSFLNNFNKFQKNDSDYELKIKDSISNAETDNENIYDEPNTEYDVIYKDKSDLILWTKRIRSYDKNKKIYAYYNQSDTGPVNDNTVVKVASENSSSNNSFQRKFDNFLRKKFLTNSSSTTATSSILFLGQRISPVHHCQHHSNLLSASNRPNSRNSLNSRLSSSHNSLTVQKSNKADDSIFITQAISQDALQISDFYNVPMGSDIYSLPYDAKQKFNTKKMSSSKSKKSFSYSDNNLLDATNMQKTTTKYFRNKTKLRSKRRKATKGQEEQQRQFSKPKSKRLSVPDNVTQSRTLDEVKKYYNDSTSSETSPPATPKMGLFKSRNITSIESNISMHDNIVTFNKCKNDQTIKPKIVLNSKKRQNIEDVSKSSVKNDDTRSNCSVVSSGVRNDNNHKFLSNSKKSQFSISMNLKQKFCSIFRFKKSHNSRNSAINTQLKDCSSVNDVEINLDNISEDKNCRQKMPLPPLPSDCDKNIEVLDDEDKVEENTMDFAANIEKVKEFGWYWGNLSSFSAEKILSSEPNGSFLVRDSSDDHYIFSLSFKLNGIVRHVRIEQDAGKFSFGSCAKFKSRTIMEFIENAVEHSRSGRYLFFLHRRPEHGPMRVQLTNPVSRFKHVQSLQHLCRFIILKAVARKDLVQNLPLPRRIIDYLNNKNILSEQIESDNSSQSQVYGENNTTT